MHATLNIDHVAFEIWILRWCIPEQCVIIIEVWGQVICGWEENTELLHHTLLLPFPHIFNVHRGFAEPPARDCPADALGDRALLSLWSRAEFGGGDEVFDGRTHHLLRSQFFTTQSPLSYSSHSCGMVMTWCLFGVSWRIVFLSGWSTLKFLRFMIQTWHCSDVARICRTSSLLWIRVFHVHFRVLWNFTSWRVSCYPLDLLNPSSSENSLQFLHDSMIYKEFMPWIFTKH